MQSPLSFRLPPVLAVAVAALALAALSGAAVAGVVDLPRHPSISPDGERVVFTWRGDLWIAPATGGTARRLTSHPAIELRSAWSPDGRLIAFESTRSGAQNLHVMDPDGGNLHQVTFEDDGCALSGFGAGGQTLTFTSSREDDVYREPRPFEVPVAGGPITRIHDAHGRAPRVGPDGQRVLFTRGGSSWSRRHYRGSANRDVWLRDGANDTFRQLTRWDGNDGQAQWAGADAAYFLSDRELRTVNVWRMRIDEGGTGAERLTAFEGHDVRSFDSSADGSRVILHAWDRLYLLDTASGSEPRPLTFTAPDDDDMDILVKNVAGEIREAALSPDGKVLAYVAFGDVYVRTIGDNEPTRRVTDDAAREQQIAWSPDGVRLYFVSDRTGNESIFAATVTRTRGEVVSAYEKATSPPPEEPTPPVEPAQAPVEEPPIAPTAAPDAGDAATQKGDKPDAPSPADRWRDALTFEIAALLDEPTADREPRPSPDGTRIAFRRGRGDLAVLDLLTSEVRVLSYGWDTGLDARWSPDGRRLAWHRQDRDFNSDIWIAPADGSTPPVNISRHPDDDVNPRWSGDGRMLAFASERQDEQWDLYVVFLDRDLEALDAKEQAAYFEERGKEAKKRKPLDPTKDAVRAAGDDAHALELGDAYLRVHRVTSTPTNEVSLELLPAGDKIVYSGTDGLRVIGWDGKDDKKLRGAASIAHVSLDGETLVYVASGKAGTMKSSGGGEKTHDIVAQIELDQAAYQDQRFREAMRILGETFYHPTMKGLDWDGLTAAYLELARAARTPEEFDDVANRMLGELNASHLGIRSPPPPAPSRVPNGRLGIDAAPVGGGSWRVTHIVRDGPADRTAMPLRVGDVIGSIDGVALDPAGDLRAALRGTTGREILLGVSRPREGAAALDLEILLRPMSSGADAQLRYAEWTRTRAEQVAAWSDGRLGYLHIRSMNQSSLRDFERDLFAAAEGRDGLLVDVRNNGGGSTADYVLASIMVRAHAYTVPRGADPTMTDGYPQDRLFIQRYTRPMSMLCNERSFSNAEIVSHAFKTLGRGTLVGERTYGGVISTGATRLLDGTSVRLPFRGWYLPDGTDMENHGAQPDLRVPSTPEDESRDHDAQLRAAVDELLGRLPKR